MYNRLAGAALPTTGLAAHFASGLDWLYSALIGVAVIGALFAIKRMLPQRHTS
jgi:hypothetical protein